MEHLKTVTAHVVVIQKALRLTDAVAAGEEGNPWLTGRPLPTAVDVLKGGEATKVVSNHVRLFVHLQSIKSNYSSDRDSTNEP